MTVGFGEPRNSFRSWTVRLTYGAGASVQQGYRIFSVKKNIRIYALTELEDATVGADIYVSTDPNMTHQQLIHIPREGLEFSGRFSNWGHGAENCIEMYVQPTQAGSPMALSIIEWE